MPDLSHKASAQYWYDFVDPMIYKVVTFMESVENWTLDGNPELEAAIDKLGAELDEFSQLDLGQLGNENNFIRLAGNIKSSRGLRLLQAIDMAQPGGASRLLIHAEENSEGSEDPSGVFLRRNIVFERLRLLGRVFAEQRLKLVLKALEGDE